MALIFENKIPSNKVAFVRKVEEISKKLDIDPNWLMAVIDLETGGTFSSSTTNSIGCVGLIQFCRDKSGVTYKTIGTKKYQLSDLKAMNNLQQLDVVYNYLESKKGKMTSFIDVYLAVLFPAAMRKPDNFVLESDGLTRAEIASQNPLFDTNKDNKITVKEVKEKFIARLPQDWQDYFRKGEKRDSAEKFTRRNIIPITLTITGILAVVSLIVIYKNKIQNIG